MVFVGLANDTGWRMGVDVVELPGSESSSMVLVLDNWVRGLVAMPVDLIREVPCPDDGGLRVAIVFNGVD